MARAVILVLVLVLSSCAGPGSDDSAGSGIRGRVVRTPTCPVESEASPCPPEPVATAVVIDPEASPRRRVETGPDGSFSVSLPPGRYLIRAVPPPGSSLVPVPQPVTVEAGTVARVTVILDSRLRGP